jgi:hypothetical protein
MNSSRANTGTFLSDLQDSVQQNPVSAALIGLGVLWLFAGQRRLGTAAALLPAAAKQATSGVQHQVQKSGETLSAVGEAVVEGAREVSSRAASIGSSLFPRSSSHSDTSTQPSRDGGTADLLGSVSRNVSHTFEEHPLLLGAIGLAMGSAMASALPSTRAESELLGKASETLKEKASRVAMEKTEEFVDTAERTFSAVKREGEKQGLSADGLNEAAAAVERKIKTVASSFRSNS